MTQIDGEYSPQALGASASVVTAAPQRQLSTANVGLRLLVGRDRVLAAIEGAWRTKIALIERFGCETASLD
jgi:hypothetical protein